MSRIRSKDTQPEYAVRSLLHRLGFRFRLHRRDLPGQPDIVLPKYKSVIFVNGCFWHFHKNCKDGKIPQSNKQYWQNKLARNTERDKSNYRELRKRGWQVIVIWECEVKKRIDKVEMKIVSFLLGK